MKTKMPLRSKLPNKPGFEGFKTDLYRVVDSPDILGHLCQEVGRHPQLFRHDMGEIALKGAVFNAYSSEADQTQPFAEPDYSPLIAALPPADEKLQLLVREALNSLSA